MRAAGGVSVAVRLDQIKPGQAARCDAAFRLSFATHSMTAAAGRSGAGHFDVANPA